MGSQHPRASANTVTAITVEVLDAATGELIAEPSVGRIADDAIPDPLQVRQLAFSPDGTMLAATDSDGFTVL